MSAQTKSASGGELLSGKYQAKAVQEHNLRVVCNVADYIRTSLGPFGLDKLILNENGEVVVTNDGATILNEMKTDNPAAQILSELSKSQDIEAGDGTTSVVLVAASLVKVAFSLIKVGLHPQQIISGFDKANAVAQDTITELEQELDLADHEKIRQVVCNSLRTKLVSVVSDKLSRIAIDAVFRVHDSVSSSIDLSRIKIVKSLYGTMEDIELFDGLVLENNIISRFASGPTSCTDAKIGLIQFCLSVPKCNLTQQIQVHDYSGIDRLLRQERLIVGGMVKKIKQTGCNVLLVQKSITKEAICSLALDLCAKSGILVVRDVERADVELVCDALGCMPVASIESFTTECLGSAKSVFEVVEREKRLLKFEGCPYRKVACVILRATNSLTLDEVARSLRDALCVVRSLVKRNKLIYSGSCLETEIGVRLCKLSLQSTGAESLVLREFAKALEVIPYTLAENAGLNPVDTLTELRALHEKKFANACINLESRKVELAESDNCAAMIQPSHVLSTLLNLATETAQMLIRIDDIVACS